MACSRPWTCPTTTLWRLMTTLYQVQASKLSGNYHKEITNRCNEFFIGCCQSVLKGCIRELAGEGRRVLDDELRIIMMALRSGSGAMPMFEWGKEVSDKASNYHITGEWLAARNNPSSPAFWGWHRWDAQSDVRCFAVVVYSAKVVRMNRLPALSTEHCSNCPY